MAMAAADLSARIAADGAGIRWGAFQDQIASPAGAQSTPVHYDPYGAPLPGSADPTGMGYAGEWKNGTGLINLRARSYDPVVGRFVGRDMFGGAMLLPQTANRYAYANLNPLRYGDPSGHFGRAWNVWGASALEMVVSFNPVGYAVITGYQLLTGTDPATGAQIDRGEVLRWAAITVATVGVAAVAKAALPILRGVADDVARLSDDAAVLAGRAGGRVTARAASVGGEARTLAGEVGSAWAARGRFIGDEAGHVRLGTSRGLTDDVVQATNRGRRGSPATETQLVAVRDEFLAANPDWRLVRGGRDPFTNARIPEEYLRNPVTGRRGAAWPDLTFEGPGGMRIRINTVDADRFGNMTARESDSFARIFEITGEPIIAIPKYPGIR